MGVTSLLVLLSSKPEYNMKIKMATGLAPVAFWIKTTPTFTDIINILPTMKVTAKICDFLLQTMLVFKIQD